MKYKTIISDPPWGDGKFGPKISKHYPLMSTKAICNLPVRLVADQNSILILWTTWTHLEDAFKVMNAWGFSYAAGFPWIKLSRKPFIDLFGELNAKPSWGLGAWVRGCSEPILIGKRGNQSPPTDKHFLGLLSKRLEHSRKPVDLYEYAESFPGPYLELFARSKRIGWTSWGNEVETPEDPNLAAILTNPQIQRTQKACR